MPPIPILNVKLTYPWHPPSPHGPFGDCHEEERPCDQCLVRLLNTMVEHGLFVGKLKRTVWG